MPRRTTIGLALLVTSLLTGSALAQGGPPLNPPSGPVQAGPDSQAQAPRRGPGLHDDSVGPRAGMRGQRGQRGMRGQRQRLPPAVKAMLVQRFDRNGDGRLTGPERIRAKRFLKHQRAKMRAGAMQGGQRGGMGPR